MREIGRTLSAEMLKVKRTLALRLAFLAPLVVVGFETLVFWERGEEFVPAQLNAWAEFGQMASIFWALLVLPLFTTLQTALLGGLEHGNCQWKHLYALPIPRWAVYAAKQITAAALMGLSHLALVGFVVLAGLMLWGLRPDLGFHVAIPWGQLLRPVAIAYLASWLILSIHTWVGLRWRSFVVTMAVGIVLTIMGVGIINSEWGSFYPWALPGLIVNSLNKGEPLPLTEFEAGSIGGVVVALAGCWRVTRRDVL